MCTPVRISGEDRRKSIGKEKQQVVKEDLIYEVQGKTGVFRR